jgi:uncharacterized protein involved in exopolysaccharide biosynthesis
MTKQSGQTSEACEKEEQRINLWDCWQVIWKHKKMIAWIMGVTMVTVTVLTLSMTDIYRAKAVIIPVAPRDGSGGSSGGLGVLAQQLGGLPGISMPASSTASEIVGLLNSNILREKIIRQYNLMPVLFYKRWDIKRQAWKAGNKISIINSQSPNAISSVPVKDMLKNDPNVPDTWDALRLLDKMVGISRNSKENTITISVDFHDPELAARIVDYYLVTLTDYMSSEVKRVATSNRKYLEEQLGAATDPFIKQKIYNMIAQQIETGIMAEVKENFAFKVIDPPMAPDKIIKPERLKIVLLSMVISFFIGVCIAFFLEYLNYIKMRSKEVGK